ncbi:MAG: hypothetical protein MK135_16090 [Polyangiaceae bacterium]|nr:hypothetical protein [Polyangiaceae bacterium]
MNGNDEEARRIYWREQMESGYKIFEALLASSVNEWGESMGSIADAADAAGVEMRFSATKIAGGLERVFFLRKGLLPDLIKIGRTMNERGWVLQIEDAFRSLEMQASLVRKPEVFDAVVQKCLWETGGQIPSVDFVIRRATVMVANIPKTGTHMSGSAVDISVIRRDGSEVSRGAPYLEVSEKTPMSSPFVSKEERRNRAEITELMEAHGMTHFPFEFWHYNQGDALDQILNERSEPAQYGAINWDPQTNRVTPVENAEVPLNPVKQFEAEVEAALTREKSI